MAFNTNYYYHISPNKCHLLSVCIENKRNLTPNVLHNLIEVTGKLIRQGRQLLNKICHRKRSCLSREVTLVQNISTRLSEPLDNLSSYQI